MTGRVGSGGTDNTTPVIINEDGNITDIENWDVGVSEVKHKEP